MTRTLAKAVEGCNFLLSEVGKVQRGWGEDYGLTDSGRVLINRGDDNLFASMLNKMKPFTQ